MSYADLSQARLFYVIDGPADAPVLVLSNSLGTCADMWARQIPALTQHFRAVGSLGEGDHYPWKVYVNQITGQRVKPPVH